MKGIFKKGLLALAIVVVILVLIWVFVVDALVRHVIEKEGTQAVGARVDLAAADLSIFPLGLTLTGLAVTNPDAPMRNAVEVRNMKMDLDPGYLIRRKVIINEVLVEGLTFDTARKASGAVPGLTKEPAEPEACANFKMPSLAQLDIKAILAKEPLESMTLVKGLDDKLKAEKVRWEKELDRLADEKTIAAYRTRIDKLKGSGGSLGAILGAAGDVQQLQADIQKDLKLLKDAQKTFTTEYKSYQRQVSDLAQAPGKDIKRLMNKYSLTPDGLNNLSQLIFGQQICGWAQTALQWYEKIQPHIGKGNEDADKSSQPKQPVPEKVPPGTMPDFLIRSLKVDAELAAGKLTGKAENITPDQAILGKPTTFAFLGRELKQIASLNLIGTANFIQPDKPKSDARLTVKGLGLKNLALIKEGALPLTLAGATGNLELNLKTVGDALDALLKANFDTAKFTTGAGGQSTAMAEAIQSALAGVNGFSLNADVAGTLAAYTVKITSDLDRILKSAVGGLVQKEAAKFQAALEQQISAKLQDPLQQTQGSLAGLDGIQAELANRLNLGNDLLKGLKLPF